MSYNLKKLAVIHYPDPRLREKCKKITEFDADLAALSRRMFELMKATKGVGLAAPQVGVPIRMFVMNPTAEDKNNVVVINPIIRDKRDNAEAEEGCLSLPGINVQVRRAAICRIAAQNLKGETIEMEADGLVARIWQHETDHLNGVLIIDRMLPSDKIATRKTLAALEASFQKKSPVKRGTVKL